MYHFKCFKSFLFMHISLEEETESHFFLFPMVHQVFNATSCHEPSSGNTVNVSSERQFADIVLGQHTLPSWYYASIDAVPRQGTVSLHSQNRWRTQMAFSKTVYSFEVKEDTVPG